MTGRWTHSSEEDHDGVTVYRRDDFAFPPARGRRGVEFHADGSFTELRIGRGDAPESGSRGRWQPSGQLLRSAEGGGMPGAAGMRAVGVVVQVGAGLLEIDWGA